MKTMTKFFLTSACLIFMKQSAHTMRLEKESDISPARFKIQELKQKKEEKKTLDSASRGSEEGKFPFLPSKNLLLNEYLLGTDVPDKNLRNQAMDKVYSEILPIDNVAYIITFLDLTELARAVSVSSFWKTVFDVPDARRIIGLEDYASHFIKDNLKGDPKEEIRVYKMLKKATICAEEKRERRERQEQETSQPYQNMRSTSSVSRYGNFWF